MQQGRGRTVQQEAAVALRWYNIKLKERWNFCFSTSEGQNQCGNFSQWWQLQMSGRIAFPAASWYIFTQSEPFIFCVLL